MRIRFYNALILTLDNETNVFKGELWVKDSTIEYVGKAMSTEEKFDKEIDANENLLMPGFKNAHSHSAMTFARSYADDLSLHDWLKNKIFPLEAKLTKEHIYYFSKLAYMEYLSSGITAAFDMYYEPNEIVKASIESGFRTVLCGAINNFKESVDILEGYYNKFNNCDELISYVLGFHAEYTTDISIINKIGQLSKKYKAPVYVHNSETKLEVENCIKKYGKTPTKVFEEAGIYDFGGGGFHCVYLSDEDINIFKKKGLYAVINTGSNLKLASGIAPIQKYINNGLNLAIGTDSASSNNALNIFREMYLTSVTQKYLCMDPTVGNTIDILLMATRGSALAMGLSQCDILAKGKLADIIMIDLSKPNMQPANNILNNLVYSCSKDNIKMTMINGKILYENGRYNTIDADEIYTKVNQFMLELSQ